MLSHKQYQIWTGVCSSKDSMTVRLTFNIPNQDLIFSTSQIKEVRKHRARKSNSNEIIKTSSKEYKSKV